MLRRAVRVTSLSCLTAIGAGSVALYLDAPVGTKADDGTIKVTSRQPRFPEWLHDLGRIPVIGLCSIAGKVYLNYLNTSKYINVDRFISLLDNRPSNTSLITVSNHTATVDDPAVFVSMLPMRCSLPWNGRWSLISQEYSYTRGSILAAFFFGCKSLPIKRGDGIDQPMLYDIFEKVQQGAWVHIFPEGKIDQFNVLGGRSGPRAKEIGRLKWGTAKLIARSDVRPIVLPIYHKNMQKIMPQNNENQVVSMLPRIGIPDIEIRVGEPISFDDLFEKYSHCRIAEADALSWTTEEREKELYSAIMKRIEDSLLELAKDE